MRRISTLSRIGAILLLAPLLLSACGQIPFSLPTAEVPTATPTVIALPPLPPVVVDYTPRNGAEITSDVPIQLHFDQAMDRQSVEQALRLEPAVEGQTSWQDDRTLVFRPKGLASGTRYRVSVSSEARSSQGLSLSSDVSFAFSTTGPLTVAHISPADGTADLRVDTPILLSFNRAMVPLNCAGQKAGKTDDCPLLPLTFEPAVLGDGIWVNTSLYQFRALPGWAAGQTYKGTLKAGVTSVDGATLADSVTWSFTTALPNLLDAYPSDGQTYVPLDAGVRLNFNTVMEPVTTGSAFTLLTESGEPVAGAITWENGGATLVFTPTQPLALGTHYLASVTGRARALTSAPLQNPQSWSFTTVPYPAVVRITPEDGTRNVTLLADPVRVRLVGAIDERTIQAHISISPTVSADEEQPYGYWDETGWYTLVWDKQPRTRYCVTVSPGIADRYGNTTRETTSACFTTGDRDPFLAPATTLDPLTLDAGADAILYFLSVNVPRTTFSIYGLTEKEFAAGWGAAEGELLRQWPFTFEGASNQVAVTPVVVSRRGGPLPTGFYRLAWQGLETYWKTDLRFAVVDRHLTIKLAQQEALVWVTDLRSGEPITGTEVRLMTRDAVLLAAGTTNPEGIARIPLPPLNNLWEQVMAVVGKPGEAGFGVAATDWTANVSPWNFDLAMETGPFEPYRLYLQTDRPIYRPGQTIYFRGILRQDEDGRYALPTAGQMVETSLVDSTGNTVYSTTFSLSELGTWDGAFVLTETATVGDYSLVAGVPGMERRAWVSISVAAYRKPEFQVTVTPEQEDLSQGTTLRALVEASYYFGGPVGGATVHWTVRATPYTFNPQLDGDWQWGRTIDWPLWEEPEVITEGVATTDAQGRWLLQLPADLRALYDAKEIGSQRWTVEATVTDDTGFPVSGRGELTVHATRFYLGLQPHSRVVVAGNKAEVAVRALDWAGQPVANQTVELVLARRTWYQQAPTTPLAEVTWGYTDTVASKLTVTTDAEGAAVASLTPPRSGSYVVLASAADADGHLVRSETTLWVSGPEAAAWQLSEGEVTPVADAQRYRSGDTAKVLLPTPFAPPFRVLMTVERGGILNVRQFVADASNPLVEIPITEAYVPNVYVSFVVVKGVDATTAVPDIRIGFVKLTVEPVAQTLKVEVTPDRTTAYAPGESAVLTVRTVDAQGKTVDAEVTLAVVDKAVLALRDPNSSPIVEGFYAERPLSVVTGDGLLLLFNRVSANLAALQAKATLLMQQMLAGGYGGGGGGPASPSEIRSEFPDTAFWEAHLRTGTAGQTQVRVPLPDSLTTWVADARAVTADTRVGQATAELVVSQPLLVRPVTPRFLIGGDRPELAAVVHNNSDQDLEVAASLLAEGVTVEEPVTQTVTIPAGGRVRVSWQVQVPDTGGDLALLTFTAEGGGYADRTRPPLGRAEDGALLIYRYATPDVMGTAGVLDEADSRAEALFVPAEATAGTLTVRLEPSLAAGLTGALTYLERFPYDSTEMIVSRFLPNVFTYRTLRTLNIADPTLEANLQLRVSDALDRLYSRQNLDGGWGWWHEASSPYLTAYVALGMITARQAGFPLRQESLDKAVRYLQSVLEQAGRNKALNQSHAFIVYVLGLGAYPWPEGVVGDLYTVQASLGVTGQGYLALAIGQRDAADPRFKTLLEQLRGAAVTSATGAHWEDVAPAYWATDTRATAIIVTLLTRFAPDDPLLVPAVRWLMVARRGDGWATTQETVWALLALSDYMAASGELKANYRWGAVLNGASLSSGQADAATLSTPAEVKVSLEQLWRDRINALEVTRGEGEGRLYYTAHLALSQPAATVTAEARGISIRREYCAVTSAVGKEQAGETLPPCAPLTEVRSGELVEVHLTLVVPATRYFLTVEDPYPAGMEPVNPALLTEAQALPEPGVENVTGSRPWWNPFDQQELRDERAVFFAREVPAGTYRISYLLRGAVPGVYQALPATASELYFPEVWGRTEGMTLQVLSAVP